MQILAGTSKGVFTVEGTGTCQTLESRGVRELAMIGARVFAGTGDGVCSSDDGGLTWTRRGLDGREVWQVRGASDDSIFATTAPAGLFRSRDQGATWQELPSLSVMSQEQCWGIPFDPPLPGRARALIIDQADPRHFWVGVEVGGIAETRDGGETWKVTLPGDNPDLHMMFAHPVQPNVLYASTGYGRLDGVAEMVEGNAGVFRSDDGGAHWTYAWRGITPRYSRPMCIDPRPPYGLTVASAPTAFSSFKEEHGARAMLFRTEDGGESWRPLCDLPSHANFHGLTTDPSTPGSVLVGTDSGEVWQVTSEGQWHQCASGLPAVLAVVAI
ncbi:MAG: hypothetical protein O2780_17550 [Proteobacteria bacterium]|nr:hypothetical protein [Pseudomonadota bacterium]